MTADDLGWAILFLAIVALFVFVGIAVGMIVAGRIDRLQAPRLASRPEEPAAGTDAGATDEPAPEPAQEEQQP